MFWSVAVCCLTVWVFLFGHVVQVTDEPEVVDLLFGVFAGLHSFGCWVLVFHFACWVVGDSVVEC